MHYISRVLSLVDPKYEEEVSGCTASVGIISRDKIWVVSFRYNLSSDRRLRAIGKCRRLPICSRSQRTCETVVV